MMRNINKHIPLRTCIACRIVRPKRELTRLVRINNGSVELDTSGKRIGRGAYLCPECWETGLRGAQLKRALRTTLTQDNIEQLIKATEKLC
jgi:predicted RNA-binding protein YlxR (DUF448 family)